MSALCQVFIVASSVTYCIYFFCRYDFSTRCIYPLFQDCGLDFSVKGIDFVSNLRKVLIIFIFVTQWTTLSLGTLGARLFSFTCFSHFLFARISSCFSFTFLDCQSKCGLHSQGRRLLLPKSARSKRKIG